jgi:hypothetical protein
MERLLLRLAGDGGREDLCNPAFDPARFAVLKGG